MPPLSQKNLETVLTCFLLRAAIESREEDQTAMRNTISRRQMMGQMTMLAGGFVGMRALSPVSRFSTEGPVVETNSGKIRGTILNGIHNFRGVPYGAR
jgi:hypothetical protein